MSAGYVMSEQERMQQPCSGCGVVLESHFEPVEKGLGKMWIPCAELAKRQAEFASTFGVD